MLLLLVLVGARPFVLLGEHLGGGAKNLLALVRQRRYVSELVAIQLKD